MAGFWTVAHIIYACASGTSKNTSSYFDESSTPQVLFSVCQIDVSCHGFRIQCINDSCVEKKNENGPANTITMALFWAF